MDNEEDKIPKLMKYMEKFTKKAWNSPSGMIVDIHECEGDCEQLHILIYPSVRELVGGSKDGQQIYARFVLEINKFVHVFDKRPQIFFDSAVGYAVPNVRFVGSILKNQCDVSVYCCPPADAKPTERVYTQGAKKGMIEHADESVEKIEEETEE